jgi:hypothetical protein
VRLDTAWACKTSDERCLKFFTGRKPVVPEMVMSLKRLPWFSIYFPPP